MMLIESGKDFLHLSHRRRHGWKSTTALVGVSVFLVLLALDFGVRSSLYNNNINDNSGVMTTSSSSLLRRFLQDFEFVDLDEDGSGSDEPSPLAKQVKDAIKDGMDSGEIGSNHDAVVNVSWVPLEDIEDDDETPAPRSIDDDDNLEPLWIVIICLGGALVLLLICLAYCCMRQAEREMDHDIANANTTKDVEDPNNNGAVTSAGEEDDDDDVDDESSKNDEAVGGVGNPHSGDPNLGKFQVSDDNNNNLDASYDEEIVDEESSSHDAPPLTNQGGVRFHDQSPRY